MIWQLSCFIPGCYRDFPTNFPSEGLQVFLFFSELPLERTDSGVDRMIFLALNENFEYNKWQTTSFNQEQTQRLFRATNNINKNIVLPFLFFIPFYWRKDNCFARQVKVQKGNSTIIIKFYKTKLLTFANKNTFLSYSSFKDRVFSNF